MKQILEYQLPGSSNPIFIEVEPGNEGFKGEQEASRLNRVTQKAKHNFQDIIENVIPVADVIIRKSKMLQNKPEELEVEFGLKLSLQLGAVISSSALDANFKVRLKWKRE